MQHTPCRIAYALIHQEHCLLLEQARNFVTISCFSSTTVLKCAAPPLSFLRPHCHSCNASMHDSCSLSNANAHLEDMPNNALLTQDFSLSLKDSLETDLSSDFAAPISNIQKKWPGRFCLACCLNAPSRQCTLAAALHNMPVPARTGTGWRQCVLRSWRIMQPQQEAEITLAACK